MAFAGGAAYPRSTCMRSLAALAALLGVGIVAASCSHGWDDYDPRLGGGGGSGVASTGSEGVGPSSGATTAATGPGSSTSQSSASQGSGGDGGAGPGSTSTADGAGGSSSTGTPTLTLEIEAIEADCIDPSDLDPDQCDAAAAANAFTLDAEANFPAVSWSGYLRFSPGDELAGRTVDSVRLRLRTSGEERSDSDDSGTVWECEAWDRASLPDGPPDKVGSAPVAVSVGAVGLDEEVVFNLVGLIVAANTPVYLAVETGSIDGVDYLDERSATPPTLVVTYH